MTVIRDIVYHTAKVYGVKTAFQIERGEKYFTVSYEECLLAAEKIAGYLYAKGYRKGDRIALIGNNSPEWSIVYLGIQIGGYIGIPIDRLLSINEIQHILIDSGSKYLFADDKFAEMIEPVRGEIPDLDGVFILNADSEQSVYSLPVNKGVVFPDIVPEDEAVYLYTSGTTGKTKGVILSQHNIIANLEGCRVGLPLTSDDSIVSILPLHHAYEMTAGFLYAFSKGVTITYSLSLVARDIIKAIKDSRATVMVGVPLVFEKMYNTITKNIDDQPLLRKTVIKTLFLIAKFKRLYDKRMNATKSVFKPLLSKAGLMSIRHFVAGAAPLPPHVNQFFYVMGIPILQGYGLSETSPVVSVVSGKDIDFFSVGPPFHNLKVRIYKPGESGIGEIVIRGPSVMNGYYREPEKTKQVLKRGWLYTGDFGFIDEKGRLHIKGRLKNVIISTGGKNIYPEEIEDVLMQSHYIEEIVVYGKEEPEAMVYPNFENVEKWAHEHKHAQLDDDTLLSLIKSEIDKYNEKLAPYKRVRKITLRKEEFPKTSTRKIKRFLIGQE